MCEFGQREQQATTRNKSFWPHSHTCSAQDWRSGFSSTCIHKLGEAQQKHQECWILHSVSSHSSAAPVQSTALPFGFASHSWDEPRTGWDRFGSVTLPLNQKKKQQAAHEQNRGCSHLQQELAVAVDSNSVQALQLGMLRRCCSILPCNNMKQKLSRKAVNQIRLIKQFLTNGVAHKNFIKTSSAKFISWVCHCYFFFFYSVVIITTLEIK